jgi:HK97 gp10 family phage protein
MAQTIAEIKLQGFDELRAELATLSRNMQRQGGHAMASAGAAVVRGAAKAYVPSSKYTKYYSYIEESKGEFAGLTIGGRSKWGGIRTEFTPGYVAKNIFMGKSIKKSKIGNAWWRVFLAPQAWFGRWLEYGVPSKGIPATSFMRNAVKQNQERIIDVMRYALMRFLYSQRMKIIKVRG